MSRKSQDLETGRITHGDLFDDLGFSREETLVAKIKADILQALLKEIDRRRLSQAQIATALKAHQPDVSNLLMGKISKFSITRLIQFAGRLNLEARLEVTESRAEGKKLSLKASSGKTARRSRVVLSA